MQFIKLSENVYENLALFDIIFCILCRLIALVLTKTVFNNNKMNGNDKNIKHYNNNKDTSRI